MDCTCAKDWQLETGEAEATSTEKGLQLYTERVLTITLEKKAVIAGGKHARWLMLVRS